MDTNETVNLILEGNGWDLGAVPIENWLPTAAKRMHETKPHLDILNDPHWYKDLDEDAKAWFAEGDNVMEFLLDNYETDEVIEAMRTLLIEYNLNFAPLCMESWDRFAKTCGKRLIEMAD